MAPSSPSTPLKAPKAPARCPIPSANGRAAAARAANRRGVRAGLRHGGRARRERRVGGRGRGAVAARGDPAAVPGTRGGAGRPSGACRPGDETRRFAALRSLTCGGIGVTELSRSEPRPSRRRPGAEPPAVPRWRPERRSAHSAACASAGSTAVPLRVRHPSRPGGLSDGRRAARALTAALPAVQPGQRARGGRSRRPHRGDLPGLPVPRPLLQRPLLPVSAAVRRAALRVQRHVPLRGRLWEQGCAEGPAGQARSVQDGQEGVGRPRSGSHRRGDVCLRIRRGGAGLRWGAQEGPRADGPGLQLHHSRAGAPAQRAGDGDLRWPHVRRERGQVPEPLLWAQLGDGARPGRLHGA